MISELNVEIVVETPDVVKYACHMVSKDGTKTELPPFAFHKPFTDIDVATNVLQRLMELGA